MNAEDAPLAERAQPAPTRELVQAVPLPLVTALADGDPSAAALSLIQEQALPCGATNERRGSQEAGDREGAKVAAIVDA